ncbi:MAG: membrane integrity-associated transporter subunit PqiC [Verrucomicrobia subdivision 3 bacterium]|nr:membrane integrity-associated transporter subunit PqiC [Limisphaerales bacterium]
MKIPSLAIRLLLTAAAGIGLTGCLGFLKPSPVNTRHFVLTPLPAGQAAGPTSEALAVGVGFVKLPAYLFNNAVAMRQGENEITYRENEVWAERLDHGLQRILAANLASLLPTDRVRLSTWQPTEVAVEVYVTVEQFDVDRTGRGVLVAWWCVRSAGGEFTLRAGEFRAGRPGPVPSTDPQGAVATLSELAADLSREIAAAIRTGSPQTAK